MRVVCSGIWKAVIWVTPAFPCQELPLAERSVRASRKSSTMYDPVPTPFCAWWAGPLAGSSKMCFGMVSTNIARRGMIGSSALVLMATVWSSITRVDSTVPTREISREPLSGLP